MIALPLLLLLASASGAGVGAKPIDPGSWVVATDYPPAAMAAHIQGGAGFRVEVGIDGKPTDCGILKSSGSQELDMATCDILMSRARFIPAVGQDGKPAVGYYSSAVKWVLPDYRTPWRSMASITHIDIDSNGKVSRCHDDQSDLGTLHDCRLLNREDLLSRVVPVPLTKLKSVEIRHLQNVADGPGLGDPMPPGASRSAVGRWVLAVDPSGHVASCHQQESSLPIGATPTFCDPATMAGMTFPVSPSGVAPRTVTMTTEIVTQPR